MGLHKRNNIGTLLDNIDRGERKQVYLCFGERYLCRQVVEQLEQHLQGTQPGSVHGLDGASEDSAKLLARLLSFTLLPGLQIYRVIDTNLFHSKEVGEKIWEKACNAYQNGKSPAAARHLKNLLQLGSIRIDSRTIFSDLAPDQWSKQFGFSYPAQDLSWADRLISVSEQPATQAKDPIEKLMGAIKDGLPPNNILILTAEHVDKRKKLFTHIKKYGDIIDCSVAEGSSRAAVQQQKDVIREMALEALKKMDKTIDSQALDLLFERVGFHPVGAVLEVEKLALYIDDRPRITVADINQMVSRTREDAVFELTEAFGNNNISTALIVLDHLLSDGVHGLAIVASLRNYLRRMLIFNSLQKRTTPSWSPSMSSNEFQNSYLPALKETGLWPELLKGHPYALYMGFRKASQFRKNNLKSSLSMLLDAEFKLKGSPVPLRIVLEELLITLVKINRTAQM